MWQPELQMSANHPERTWLPSGGLAAITEAVGAAIAVGPADAHARGESARHRGIAFTATDGAGLEQAISHASTTDQHADLHPTHIVAFDLGSSAAQNVLHRVQRSGAAAIIAFASCAREPPEGGLPPAS